MFSFTAAQENIGTNYQFENLMDHYINVHIYKENRN